MSATTFLFCVFALWVVIGVVSALVMGRRGHAPYPWLLLGAVLGPLVIPIALAQSRDERRVGPAPVAGPSDGRVAVLVGVDGSAESLAAADLAADLFDERLGRLTLATVVSYEAGSLENDERRAADAVLAQVASHVRGHGAAEVETIVLAGRPDAELAAYAREGGFDLLVVGRRGRGASKLVLGSVARRLSEGAPVPVLVANGSSEG